MEGTGYGTNSAGRRTSGRPVGSDEADPHEISFAALEPLFTIFPDFLFFNRNCLTTQPDMITCHETSSHPKKFKVCFPGGRSVAENAIPRLLAEAYLLVVDECWEDR